MHLPTPPPPADHVPPRFIATAHSLTTFLGAREPRREGIVYLALCGSISWALGTGLWSKEELQLGVLAPGFGVWAVRSDGQEELVCSIRMNQGQDWAALNFCLCFLPMAHQTEVERWQEVTARTPAPLSLPLLSFTGEYLRSWHAGCPVLSPHCPCNLSPVRLSSLPCH